MPQIKHKTALSLILLFSIFALVAAYFIQYVLGHQPCNLCLIQRIPYIFSILIISICLFTEKFEKITLITLSLTFFITTLFSFYHFGIEQGFIMESLVCDLNVSNNELSKEDLLNQLREVPVSCKNVTFKIFGLSLATFNIFISLVLGAITTKIFLTYEKNK
ncbi:disulfide bond formation protein B [Candidatus Pelagibacter sp.]|jgi:disulfide bond formation protein DsbB|nr:disulfide bond formation protein B [Candidatus Pelagibacter sp.]|tara:strand:- start:343 stop:828 length:486 start_codon:yes stop_codon:yes gene_type:complete